jgi:DNA-binding CsgD family transcriptional regulator
VEQKYTGEGAVSHPKVKSWGRMIERELIEKLYRKKKLSMQQIADTLDVSRKTIEWRMKKFKIPSRSIPKALKLKRKNRFTYNPKGQELLELVGLCLYWAEGSKSHPRKVELTNSDPEMIKIFLTFLRKVCGVSEQHLRCRIQLHNSNFYQESLKYWSSVTNLSQSQFIHRYLKKDKKGKRKHPLGILTVSYNDTGLKEIILERISHLPLLTSLM